MAYTAPTPADLKQRYPEFASVADDTVQFWITDAQRTVTPSWFETDYAPAIEALAAHNMKSTPGVLSGSGGAVAGLAAAGVTDFKSGAMSVSFDAGTIANAAAGGYRSTIYGRQYDVYRRRNRGGPSLVGCVPGCLPC